MIVRPLCCLWLLTAIGCSSIAPPPVRHPGTAESQRRRAEEFDPYPLPELGPETEARPRGFLLPQAPNERVQNDRSFMERFHQTPPPGVYRGPRNLPGEPVPFMSGPAPQMAPMFAP